MASQRPADRSRLGPGSGCSYSLGRPRRREAAPASGSSAATRTRVRRTVLDVNVILDVVNASRLPGQPPAGEPELREDLTASGASLAVLADQGSRGVACAIEGARGSSLCWLYGPDDRAFVRRLVERALGPVEDAVSAFTGPTAVGWGIPGLGVDGHPETHRALVELGFRPRRRWLYMVGSPAPSPSRVADLVQETRPRHWVLTVLHCDDPVANAWVELGADGRGVVRWIAVAESFRRRGLGRALLDQATGLLGSQGAGTVVLYVEGGCAHSAALRLYEAAGFAAVERLCEYERRTGAASG